MKKTNWETRKTITIDGEKVTASAAMLNRISLWIQESADADEKQGNYKVADIIRKIGVDIYDQLDAMGYYDNVK